MPRCSICGRPCDPSLFLEQYRDGVSITGVLCRDHADRVLNLYKNMQLSHAKKVSV